jgi:3-methyl-2-oxobutanoate hydroxymethyltransferase
MNKFTVKSFQEAKENHEKITMLTAYDYSTAGIVDKAGIDSILVGDSLGMVVQGLSDTLPVTVDEMIYHCKSVKRALNRAFLICDMPFMSYQVSVEEAVRNAGRLVKEGGAEAVKVEGGKDSASTVAAIVKAQIPVMGHIGLTPQSIHVFGGFKVQGKLLEEAEKILGDAKAIEKAGAFAITLEGIPEELAKLITENLTIPTIGIGAGKYCDGQVLVVNDLLGMYSDFVPKFVKQFAHLSDEMDKAIKDYIQEVQTEIFPAKEHTYSIDQNIIDELKNEL